MWAIVLAGVAWYLIGMRGAAFWWKGEWGTLEGLGWTAVFLGGGPLGPFAWAVGRFIHGPRRFVGRERMGL